MNYSYQDYYIEQRPFFRTDLQGNLLPPIDCFKRIPEYNKLVLVDLVAFCRSCLGEDLLAIYFRGSRLLDAYSSDFDTVLITKGKVDRDMGKLLNNRLSSKFLNIKHYDTLMLSINDLLNDRSLQFIIKVLSVRVFGKQIEESILHFQINKELLFFIPKIEEKLSSVKLLLRRATNSVQKQQIINYTVKFTIRGAFELVIERAGIYTRDIDICNNIFGEYYPKYSIYSRDILAYYSNKVVKNDTTAFMFRVDSFCKLILDEYNVIYGNSHKPNGL